MRHKPNRKNRTIKITNANTVGKKTDAFSPKECAGVLQQILYRDPEHSGETALSPTASYQQGAGGRNWFPWCFSGCTGSFIWAFSKTVIILKCTLFLRFKKFKKWLWYKLLRVKTRNIHQNWLVIQEEEDSPNFWLWIIFKEKMMGQESLAGHSPWWLKRVRYDWACNKWLRYLRGCHEDSIR